MKNQIIQLPKLLSLISKAYKAEAFVCIMADGSGTLVFTGPLGDDVMDNWESIKEMFSTLEPWKTSN
jgi:hypothetical protein